VKVALLRAVAFRRKCRFFAAATVRERSGAVGASVFRYELIAIAGHNRGVGTVQKTTTSAFAVRGFRNDQIAITDHGRIRRNALGALPDLMRIAPGSFETQMPLQFRRIQPSDIRH
jgi:hypothetical protein